MENITKEELKDLILKFITQAKEKTSLSYKDYSKLFLGTKIKASFGQGGFAEIPWIAFLGYEQEVRKGIYPVILFCKATDELNICYGVSETNPPDKEWKNINHLSKFFCFGSKKYKDSIVYKKFDINNLDIDDVVDSIEKVIKDFKNIFEKEGYEMDKKTPLNQILYGPPGTGKTYSVIQKAVEIIDGKVSNDRDELKKRFNELKEAGQIEFITFHQSYSYEEFVEGLKPDIESEEIRYKIEDGVFKKISDEAKENYENSLKESILNIDKLLNEFADFVDNIILKDDKLYITSQEKPFKEATYIKEVKRNKEGNLQSFITYGGTKNQSLTINVIKRDIENFMKGKIKTFHDIKPSFDSKNSYHGNAIYYFGLYEKIKKFYEKNKYRYVEQKEPLKNYILIIDEINRGNISKIFGELITLIEESKRIGNIEELKTTLPYSKESFGVPKNLYIIGTMNTADRSIALMDTALRRRFEFVEIMPNSNILNDDIDGINLQKLLQTINKRIEYLYDRDHMIGHAYFLDIDSFDELQKIFKNKIMPLLAEYFYDDWEKIRLILGDNQKEQEYQFIQKLEGNQKELFGEEIEYENEIYKINKDAFKSKKSYIKIYDNN